jgi:hypothetical protein
MKHRKIFMTAVLLAASALSLSLARVTVAQQSATIKVGVLHSLSGTMAISETTLKDTILMMIDEQNKKGGLLGKKLEAVVVDPASNWPLFAESCTAAREGQSRCCVRMLDFGIEKVGSAGFREEQRVALLSGPVRRRRVFEERHLHGRCSESAGHSGCRLPDEGPRRKALGS